MSTRSQRASHISRFWWLALLLILSVYLALGFYQINLPGLHYDEAFEAVPALQLLRGQPVTAFRNSGLFIGGRLFPLMTQDYIGTLNLYGALPFIAVLGPTPAALRSMSVLTGALTLLFTFLLAARLAGHRWVGLLAALLLAADPTFIFWNRQGVFVTAVTATIGVVAAYVWLRRVRDGGIHWSLLGGFLFGVGLYAKFLFLWLIFALAGAALLVNLPDLIRRRNRLVPHIKKILFPEAALVAAAFALGCGPLILYNLQTGGTFASIGQNAATSYYGVNNLAVGSNLLTRLGQLVTLLNGGHLWYLGQVIRNPLAPVVFVGTAALVIAVAVQKPFTPTVKAALFPWLVIGLVVVASVGTVSALWITHFALLMPWPALAIAVGSGFVWANRRVWGDSAGRVIGAALLLGLVILPAANLLNSVRYHRALAQSGGLSAHSDAVYDLTGWLAAHANGPVVAMDWGLAAPVVYLTGGQVNATEVFGYRWQPDASLAERLNTFVVNPETLYLWRAPDEIIFDRSGEFKSLYRPLNLEETIEEAFYERSGRPLLGVTRLVEQGTADNPPQ